MRHSFFLLAFAIFLPLTAAAGRFFCGYGSGCTDSKEREEVEADKYRETFVTSHLASKKLTTPDDSTNPNDFLMQCVAAVAGLRWELRNGVALGKMGKGEVKELEKKMNEALKEKVADMFVQSRGTNFNSCSQFYIQYRLFQKENGIEVASENFSTDGMVLAKAMGQMADTIFVELFQMASARGEEQAKMECEKKKEWKTVKLDEFNTRAKFMDLHRYLLDPTRQEAIPAEMICQDALRGMHLQFVEAMNLKKLSPDHYKHFSKQMSGFTEEIIEQYQRLFKCVEVYINYRLFQLEQTGQKMPDELEIASLQESNVEWMREKARQVYAGIANSSAQISHIQSVSSVFENDNKPEKKHGKE